MKQPRRGHPPGLESLLAKEFYVIFEEGKRSWSDGELTTLRECLRETFAGEGISQGEAARRADVPASTLSQFLNAEYKGNSHQVARRLSLWLDALNRERDFRTVAPPEPSFVRTRTAGLVFAALQHAQLLSDLAIVVGPPGCGKTAAAQQFSKTTPRIVTVTCSPAISSAASVMLGVLHQSTGVRRLVSHRSLSDRSAAVREAVEPGSLILVDEAQHASMAALEELRAIHDARGCGLVLMGNATVLSRIEGAKRDPAYAQLFSRAGWRVVLEKASEEDVAMVLATMSISDADILKTCVDIARKESLRVVIKAVRAAVFLASGANENLGQKHLQAAYRQATARAA